ncbi:fasciclin domain-containing protein [Pedobacter xixiisoli]|uniref:Uncaracterized surface protein containing fasciclin (FAS1) repeats n=1 Tax=Pedobacter xixiisoli TaxID=1476464 RepID=A0A285ZUN7_9SPHI|nr:fasciclin domain-containing protein [Pedobacter xixiisoli]SOD13346.1 Uncaracterized surface protein containing fasciclin (FAS1) repeats [Pedobacter xixiisoli]
MAQRIKINQKNKLFALLLMAALGVSCRKDENKLSDYDNNKINLVIADNFNLSAFSAALRLSGLDKKLQEGNGPYTTLVPSDAAFTLAGYNNAVAVLTANPSTISGIANYHTLDGKYELNKLPFLFNQELRSRGGKLYATHWIKGQDTVLTLNGSRVVSQNIPASNGLIQVLNRVLTPYVHDLLGDAIAAEASATLFTQALKTSGVLETINGAGPYTIFAPNNTAMQAFGYQTIEQVTNTDVEELKRLVNYHILRDRRFVYDYILSTGTSNSSRQAMLDGNSVTMKLVPDSNAPGSFSGITLRGIGNTADVKLSKQDLLAGNGVLHIIDGVLRMTQ